jgi:preprotein translocase subunit SecD
MFKKPRLVILFILLVTISAILIDLPRIPVKINLGPVKIDTVVAGPNLDFNIFGIGVRRNFDVKLGLDLKGGTSLVLKAGMNNIASADRDKALEAAKQVIERRVNFLGVAEPVVQTAKVGSEYRIIVELPGVTDVSQAKQLVGQTAKLEFRQFKDPNTQAGTIPTLDDTQPTGVSGKDLKSASVDYQNANSSSRAGSTPVVRFSLKSESASKFGQVTKSLIGKPLAVFLDDSPISWPTVQSEIDQEGIITGVSLDEAQRLAVQLSAGALPVEKIDVISERTIGPTLGKVSIDSSLVAGAVGILSVMIFMAVYYGVLGILADAALVLYTSIVLALFKAIPVTLTLAGIAGFILSIGMAVDANILIFERMKEELRVGRNRVSAIEIGFSRAWTSIRDSNVSSLITSGILFWFGTGSVRGFALALAIGIFVSMFTAIIITRNFLRLVYRNI